MATTDRPAAGLRASATPFTPSVSARRSPAPTQKDFDALTHQLKSVSLVANEPLHAHPDAAARPIDAGVSSPAGCIDLENIIGQAPQSPSAAYLAATTARSARDGRGPGAHQQQPHKPQLVVLDLNGTLCVRPQKTAKGAHKAIPRPYLSAFLEYLLGAEVLSNGKMQPRFAVMIWSSAQGHNVSTMLTRLGLGSTRSGAGYLLEAIWDRQSFGLSPDDFNRKVQVVKDLDKIWSIVQYEPAPASSDEQERWSQHDTVLIDDSPHKAVLQPNNHLCIPDFLLADARAQSLELDSWRSERQPSQDVALLRVIGVLEALREQSNISACLKEGAWSAEDGKLKSEDEWEAAGRATLDRLGIDAKPGFDETWPTRVKLLRNAYCAKKTDRSIQRV